MINIRRSLFVFLLILVQTVLAVSAGLVVLYLESRNSVPANVYVEALNIGELSRKEASNKIKEYFSDILQERYITINIDENKEYKIKYSEIDASIDHKATTHALDKIGRGENFFNIIGSYFYTGKKMITPIILINEGKLREKLSQISIIVDSEPRNADIKLEGDRIIKTAEVPGLKLNLENALNKVKNELYSSTGKPIEFKPSNNYEIDIIIPRVTMKDLEGADEIVSTYSTKILHTDLMASINKASRAINKVLLHPADEDMNLEADEFSFNKYLAMENTIEEKDNEGYNQVVSTLYAAVLAAGIDRSAITRVPGKNPTEYIIPGLDARVEGNSIDFRFVNTFKHRLIIFSEVRDAQISVSLVSKKENPSEIYEVTSEIIQKYKPTVINVENNKLEKGQVKLVSPGKEGLKVSVYRITLKDGIEAGNELISTDVYAAIKSVFEIGPGTEWNNEINK